MRFFVFVTLLVSLSACNNSSMVKDASDSSTGAKRDAIAVNIDSTVDPSQDFFLYANGKWIKQNSIPADQSTWGIGNLVNEENNKRFREINEKAASSHGAKGSTDQKLGDFWTTAMDSVKVEQQGLQPLQSWFDRINAITDARSLMATVAEMKKIGSRTLFRDFIGQDLKKSDVMSLTLYQGALGLPEREYYFKNDSTTVNIRKEYVNYISKILSMSGQDSNAARSDAKNILAMETKLAQASRKREMLRDDYKNYNKMAIADLPKMSPGIDWITYLNTADVKNIDSVIVGQPEYFKALGKTLTGTPIALWKSYLKFNLIDDYSNQLPDAYAVENFNFQKLFSGAKERKPRWKRVIDQENRLMGEVLGQLYVKSYISPKDKERYNQMTENIREAFAEHIKALSWMSDSTKQKALAKLAAVKKKVYYPDKWKDYSAMEISNESYAKNIMNANLWNYNYEINKLGKPVDRDEWGMTPQTYNAEYNPSNNDITLPAAQFIVPGFKDEDLDDAVVYGYGAASTIGHEITHGFDDQGRKYDAYGNLSKWWTDKDSIEFSKRAKMIVQQFNEFEPLPGYHINGETSQGENIADLGGIVIGLDAFKKTEQYKKGEKINGLTPVQRFFLGYALGWLSNIRDEQLRNRLLTDEHAPAKYRVNGPFMDVDEFYSAFNIKPGSPMYRPDSLRVRIW
jgi:putative endopeptidase